MKIIRSILKTELVMVTFISIVGCVPETAYYAYDLDDGSFSADYRNFAVNPLDYPVFRSIENRTAPLSTNGLRQPDILSNYRWEVTHKVKDHYIIYSKKYDEKYCELSAKRNKRPEANCLKYGNRLNIYIYLYPDGSAYGWQFSRNPDRFLFKSDKISLIHINNGGNWSGQPWFECVERCDKLVNMR